MLAELKEDNLALTQRMRQTRNVCDEHGDVATASLIENWIDEAERRTWFLFETTGELDPERTLAAEKHARFVSESARPRRSSTDALSRKSKTRCHESEVAACALHS